MLCGGEAFGPAAALGFQRVVAAAGGDESFGHVGWCCVNYGFEAVTVRSVEDLAPVVDWLAGERRTPFLIDAKVTMDEPSWWLEEAFRGH